VVSDLVPPVAWLWDCCVDVTVLGLVTK